MAAHLVFVCLYCRDEYNVYIEDKVGDLHTMTSYAQHNVYTWLLSHDPETVKHYLNVSLQDPETVKHYLNVSLHDPETVKHYLNVSLTRS